MACDGEIAQEEIALVKSIAQNSHLFEGLDVEGKLNEYVSQINQLGNVFLSSFLKEMAEVELSEEFQLDIVKIAISTIEADNNIEYSEIKFFKKIRAIMTLSDGKIEKAFPEREDMDTYLLPDMEDSEEVVFCGTFSTISF